MRDRGSESGASAPDDGPGKLVFGAFCFDTANGILSRDGTEIPLAPRPLAVLRCLLERPGDVVSKQELLDEVWSDAIVGEATLSEVVGVVRKALGDDPRQPTYIQTLHRRGYRFIAEVSSETVAAPGAEETAPVEAASADVHPGEAPSADAPPRDTRSADAPSADAPAGDWRPARESRAPLTAWSLIAVVALIAAVVGFSMWPFGDSRVAGDETTAAEITPVDEPVWVLIADFDNATGQPSFDGELERALALALARSGFAAAVPQPRIDETLRLMRRPPSSPLDATIGRELSLRDGEIRALLTGRLRSLSSGHILTVEIIDPVEGLTVAGVSEETSAGDDAAAAASAVADRAVAALRDRLALLSGIPETDRLPRVTTVSLPALQLYAQAGGGSQVSSVGGRRWFPDMYAEAALEDPDFASAHVMLAWALKNNGSAPAEYRIHAERALALAEGVTEAEEYWIRGSYARFHGNFLDAATHYEALLHVDPEHPWALNNIKHSLSRYTLRFREAVPYYVAAAERAGDLAPAAAALAIWRNAPERAASYIERENARREARYGSTGPPFDGWENRFDQRLYAWLKLYPLHQRWLEGDVAAVSDELDRQAETLTAAVAGNEWPEATVNSAAQALGSFYLTLGRLTAAEAAYQVITRQGVRSNALIPVAAARHGEGDLGDAAPASPTSVIPHLAMAVTLRARGGRLSEARRLLGALDSEWAQVSIDGRQAWEPYVVIARGTLALAEGRIDEMPGGSYGLPRAVDALRPTGGIAYFRGAETLAGFWEARGDLDRARRVLEAAWRERARSHTWMGKRSYFFPEDEHGEYLYFAQSEWMRVCWKLAAINRKLGRLAEARAIEDELRELLVYADADMWLVRQLQALEESDAAPSR